MTEFFISDLDGFVKNNKVLNVAEIDFNGCKSTEVSTQKGSLIFEGLTNKAFRSLYCSCTNIKTLHFTAVANILKSALTKSTIVYHSEQ